LGRVIAGALRNVIPRRRPQLAKEQLLVRASSALRVSGYGGEIAPELTGQGLSLRKCEAYDRPYDQPLGSD